MMLKFFGHITSVFDVGAGLGAALVAGVALVLVAALFGVSSSPLPFPAVLEVAALDAAPGTAVLINSQGFRINSGML